MADITMTLVKIKEMHNMGNATPGLFYIDESGNRFIGTSEKRVISLQAANATGYSNGNARTGNATNVQGAIEGLDDSTNTRLTAIEDSFITETILDASNEDLKAFSVAMALTL